MPATMWDVMCHRCWCGERDFEDGRDIIHHELMHERRGEQPGDPFIGARVEVGEAEGTVTDIKDGHLHISWDDSDMASELPLDAPYRVLDPWA